MESLFRTLFDPQVPFLRLALIVGLLASLPLGIIGSYVVTRRIASIAGAISHSVLGGIGIGIWLQRAAGWTWFHPMFGALAAAVISALVIGLVSLRAKQREDTVIAAIWSAGMAIGLLFLSITPGYNDPMSYLFGNILIISESDVFIILALDLIVVAVGLFFFNPLQAVCFDEEFARVRNINVEFFYLLLLVLTSLTVVVLVSIVGIVLVIALLTLPAAVAGQFAGRLRQMMILSVILCALFITSGLGISYVADFPSGPVIVLVASVAYLIVLAGRRFLPSRS